MDGDPAWACPAALSAYAGIGGSGSDIIETDGGTGKRQHATAHVRTVHTCSTHVVYTRIVHAQYIYMHSISALYTLLLLVVHEHIGYIRAVDTSIMGAYVQ